MLFEWSPKKADMQTYLGDFGLCWMRNTAEQ